jgi:hypothetical protein
MRDVVGVEDDVTRELGRVGEAFRDVSVAVGVVREEFPEDRETIPLGSIVSGRPLLEEGTLWANCFPEVNECKPVLVGWIDVPDGLRVGVKRAVRGFGYRTEREMCGVWWGWVAVVGHLPRGLPPWELDVGGLLRWRQCCASLCATDQGKITNYR